MRTNERQETRQLEKERAKIGKNGTKPETTSTKWKEVKRTRLNRKERGRTKDQKRNKRKGPNQKQLDKT